MPAVTDPSPAAPEYAAEQDSSWRGWILPALGVLSLVVSCVLWSLKKQQAGDEGFTWVELHDPSLLHLMRAAEHLGGAGMPLFYLTMWGWAHLFGFTELSLRLYACAGVCGAFLTICFGVRRWFSARAAFLGAAFGLFASLLVVDQNVEARGYGLYLLLAALAVVQTLRVAEIRQPRARDLALLALSQAGLVLGHVLALVYGGLLLLSLVIVDAMQRRFRPKVYLACMAGWLALIPWLPALLSAMAVGKPHSWIPLPTLADLAIGLSFWLFGGIYYPLLQHRPIGLALGWVCAMVCVVGLVAACVERLRSKSTPHRAADVTGLLLMLAPVAFFIISYLVSPVYVGRYMLPSTLGVAILAAAWASRPGRAGLREIVAAILLLLLAPAAAIVARPNVLDVARIDQLATGRPVVCDWLDDFLIMHRYSDRRVEYPMDWQTAQAGPAAAANAYHLMNNYGSAGYLQGELLPAQTILNQPSVVVLDNAQTNWFQLSIARDPRFTWTTIAQIDPQRRLILVEPRQKPRN